MSTRTEFFSTLMGKWQGSCRTWFEPTTVEDTSAVSGEFQRVFGGQFLRHSSHSEINGKPRQGEETIVFNPATGKIEVAWMDSFHMNAGIMLSQGERSESGFTVLGEYAVGKGHPPWGWRTVYDWSDPANLIITAFNIAPSGEEAKAVEIRYYRGSR